MPTIINPLITNGGLSAAQAQSGLGLQLAITHVQIGTGAYTLDPTVGSADYARTGLVAPTETVAIAAGHVMNKAFRVDALFAGWPGTPYGVFEIGFWAGDPAAGGTLFAIWSQTTQIVQRNNIDYLASFAVTLARVPDGSVTVTFDPSTSEAMVLVNNHESAADPHTQYVLQAGDTMQGPLNLIDAGQFDNSDKAVSSKFVQRALGNFSDSVIIGVATTLNASHCGKLIRTNGSGYTLTLPDLSTVPNGAIIAIQCSGNGSVTLVAAGTDVMDTGATNLSSMVIGLGEELICVRGAAGLWGVFGSANRNNAVSASGVKLGSPSALSAAANTTGVITFQKLVDGLGATLTGNNLRLPAGRYRIVFIAACFRGSNSSGVAGDGIYGTIRVNGTTVAGFRANSWGAGSGTAFSVQVEDSILVAATDDISFAVFTNMTDGLVLLNTTDWTRVLIKSEGVS